MSTPKQQQEQQQQEEQEQLQPAFDTTTQRAILELLQTMDKKLDPLLAQWGKNVSMSICGNLSFYYYDYNQITTIIVTYPPTPEFYYNSNTKKKYMVWAPNL